MVNVADRGCGCVVNGESMGGDWKVLGGSVSGYVVDGWVDLGLRGGCVVDGWVEGLFGVCLSFYAGSFWVFTMVMEVMSG